MLAELYGAYWQEPIPITPSPRLWHYRNKVDPAFAPMQYEKPPPPDFVRDTVLGYKRRGQWYFPLDIDECRIGPEGMDTLLPAVRQWYRDLGHQAYDNRKDAGMLRHLLIRDGKRSGERMVVLITRTGPLYGLDDFVDGVQEAFPSHSIYRGFNDRSADVAICDGLELLAGKETITETLEIPGVEKPLCFQISPNSFFQTNPLATEALYGAIRSMVADQHATGLYDLYGGCGGIAFACADLVPEIYSVESVEEASIDGRANALSNSIDNVEFITEDVRHYLRFRRDEGGLKPGATVIIDPPRSGLHPKVIKRLLELAPPEIIYVSCNPKILAQELARFTERYALTALEGFDLFPHTRHVEVLARLTLKGDAT